MDINDAKFPKALELGATECVNSMTCEGGDVKVKSKHYKIVFDKSYFRLC